MDLSNLTPDSLAAVRQLAESYLGDLTHTHQVTYLSLRLFDELQSLHGFTETEKYLLECGALMHDIGWVQGWKGHHKSSLQMILDNQKLPFDGKEKLIIGSIARYHRKALPSLSHDHYAALEPGERKIVSKLAAILRIADGLDRTHTNAVSDLRCIVTKREVVIKCSVSHPAPEEKKNAYIKADLLEKVYKRKITIRM
jgi:exopolyphosphatase/guanosine-5'-triphosphate,3'-diphosphate pyrophosphatase